MSVVKSVRLQKYMAECGVASRRKSEELIGQGRVCINERVIRELGTKIDPDVDIVSVDNQTLDISTQEKLYIVFNKPRGCITTLDDPQGRKTVIDFIRGVNQRVFPVGRLDYYSEGLLILTNDGDTAHSILHPKFGVVKKYEVKVFGIVTKELVKKLQQGINCGGELLKPKSVRIVKYLRNKTWLEFELGEGKNREIRRLCEGVGLSVDKLRRISIGGLSVKDIAAGKYRMLSKAQLLKLIQSDISTTHDIQRSKRKFVELTQKNSSRVKADSRTFIKFRKKHYVETMRSREKHSEFEK
ncbi:rRNA pseudouridine synthase [Bacteriovoracaceae bacterium]|nr:rRNA pseudouridine synthase [Bacteriovoracaceae bacterium]